VKRINGILFEPFIFLRDFHGIHPAQFEVVQNFFYYDNPSKYSVETTYLRCLDLWGLPIDTNKKGLIYAWLGDLGRIPYKEQQHWRQYNVPPEGGITEHRWKTDFMAEFADPDEPVFRFKRAYDQAQEHFKSTYASELFLQLIEEDSHCYSTLDNKADKSINALENFLGTKVGTDKAKDLTQPFRILQELRSSGVAHPKGQEYAKLVKKYKLDQFTNQNKFIVRSIRRGYESIRRNIKGVEIRCPD
jgi:hypothetical protein